MPRPKRNPDVAPVMTLHKRVRGLTLFQLALLATIRKIKPRSVLHLRNELAYYGFTFNRDTYYKLVRSLRTEGLITTDRVRLTNQGNFLLKQYFQVLTHVADPKCTRDLALPAIMATLDKLATDEPPETRPTKPKNTTQQPKREPELVHQPLDIEALL